LVQVVRGARFGRNDARVTARPRRSSRVPTRSVPVTATSWRRSGRSRLALPTISPSRSAPRSEAPFLVAPVADARTCCGSQLL